MRVIAFVGPSGTGKSYRSVMVSQQYGADAIIDDGLLISHGKVIAGTWFSKAIPAEEFERRYLCD